MRGNIRHLVWIIEQFEVLSRMFFVDDENERREAQEEEFLPGFNLHLNGFHKQLKRFSNWFPVLTLWVFNDMYKEFTNKFKVLLNDVRKLLFSIVNSFLL